MKLLTVALASLTLSGCAYQMTLMPRDSGKVYAGILNSDGTGAGTMSLNLDGDECAGPVARVASNQTFGFANTYGGNNRGVRAAAFTTTSTTGDVSVKAMLSCKSGKGLRCDLTGQGATGGGICLDDAGRIYDAIAVRK